LIYINDDYGRGIRRTFAAEFDRIGGVLVSDDPALPSTSTLEPYLSRLRRNEPDALILATDAVMAERILQDMSRLGIRWPVAGGDALVGIQRLGAAAEGMRLTAAYLPDAPGPRNQAFVAAYATAFPGMEPDHRGAGAYDIVHLLARAVTEEGTDRRSIREYLASVGSTRPAFEGVTGNIAFNAKGDVAGRGVLIGVVRNGRLVTESANEPR
jgi:branched-chain amino acid transport system substrate-binding protein